MFLFDLYFYSIYICNQPMKILCLGDSQTDFLRTFDKLALLVKKQQFDCLLCLGDLFSKDADTASLDRVLNTDVSIAIPTYFTCGTAGLPPAILQRSSTSTSGQICKNLYLLGDRSSKSLSDDIVVKFHTSDSADSAALGSPGQAADILLTACEPSRSEISLLAVLSSTPRYHFWPSQQYRESAPYHTQVEGRRRITREIALAPVANKDKAKWFYAFNITNEVQSNAEQSNIRPNPYVANRSPDMKRKLDTMTGVAERSTEEEAKNHKDVPTTAGKKPPAGYICKICSAVDEHYFKDCPDKESHRKKKRGVKDHVPLIVDPDACFFCLSNSNLARHLIVSIGDAGTYVVLPKGGMTQNHVIILPVDHKPTMRALGDARGAVQSELNHYVDAIETFYESLGLVGIVFEISRSTGVHCHCQMMPIPEDKVADLIDAFHAFAETEGLNLSDSDVSEDEDNFFRVRLPNSEHVLTAKVDPRRRFDLQFGRRVISDVMGVPECAHWKDCLRTLEQETRDAEVFKKAFKPFDFTLS